MTSANVRNDSTDLLCNHCGQTFSAFLHQMADKNARVVCPHCGGSHDGKPPKSAQSVVAAPPVKKTN